MRSRKSQKLDLNETYPCPCRRRGIIQPIVLTEAFGCNRCQQIFVVQDEGYCIEQLTNHYPYKTWYWIGHEWLVHRRLSAKYYLLLLSIVLCTIFIFLLIWTTVQSTNRTPLQWGIILVVLMSLLAMLVWAARR